MPSSQTYGPVRPRFSGEEEGWQYAVKMKWVVPSTDGKLLTTPNTAGEPAFNNGETNLKLIVGHVLEPDLLTKPNRIPFRLSTTGHTVPFPPPPECAPSKSGYMILDLLGRGTFGEAARCLDLDTYRCVSVKVVKSRREYAAQGLLEIAIHNHISHDIHIEGTEIAKEFVMKDEFDNQSPVKKFLRDRERNENTIAEDRCTRKSDFASKKIPTAKDIIELEAYFMVPDQHVCIVTPLRGANLYSVMRQRNYAPLPLFAVSHYIRQICRGIAALHARGVIHSDIKLDNTLLDADVGPMDERISNPEGLPNVQIIDLGSGNFPREGAVPYQYAQSRYYRAPEVVLGLNYDYKIDIWSLGCIAAELFIGLPLFPGNCEWDLIRRQVSMVGIPPIDILLGAPRAKKYFTGLSNFTASRPPRVRSLDDYTRVTGLFPPKPKRYFKYDQLHDLVKHTWRREVRRAGEAGRVAPEEGHARAFLHFLYGTLSPDPRSRYSALQALEHPFVRCKELHPNGLWDAPIFPRLNATTLSELTKSQAASTAPSSTFGSKAPRGGPRGRITDINFTDNGEHTIVYHDEQPTENINGERRGNQAPVPDYTVDEMTNFE